MNDMRNVLKVVNSLPEAESYYTSKFSVLTISHNPESHSLEDTHAQIREWFFIFDAPYHGAGQSPASFHCQNGIFKASVYANNYLKLEEGPYLNDPLTINLMSTLLQELLVANPDDISHIYPMVCTLMHCLEKRKRTQEASDKYGCTGLTPFTVKKIEQYIAERIGQGISTPELAMLCDLSLYHFIRMFKKTTGKTPHQFVTNMKLEVAKRLLSECTDSVIQVGFAIGFDNPSHFSKVFKNHVGLTPLKYRKELVNIH